MMIGTIFIDRYRIDGLLGKGGMGIVYRAHDLLLDRDVAVKVLNKSDLSTEGRSRLLRELRAAARLNHPNIVSVYDAGEKEELSFIVMEFVEGQSLFEQRPSQINDVLAIARQICEALDHAHTHTIVHRDLKPENVLTASNGQVKLMDFGMARTTASRLTVEGCIEGTISYMAPEQALGMEIDARVDLYALGVMLYELTVGKLPFVSGDPLSIISQHLYAPVVPPRAHNDHIPPALDTLILQLMSKRAEDRPASAREVRQRIQLIEAGEIESPTSIKLSLLDRIVRGRLVGRERELAEAVGLWKKTVVGESNVLLISGDPGIGKTRLAIELIAQAQVNGAFVLKGDCYAEDSAPYAPIEQIIEAASNLGVLSNLSGLPDLLSIAPNLRFRYLNVLPHPSLDHPAEQQRLYESLVELSAVLTSQAPVLIVLEDAHWADSGTLFLLRHLARRANSLNLRLFILITYREVELDEARALNQILYDFNREHLAVRIKLLRLDRNQTCDLLSAILAEDIPENFSLRVFRETEGNPFFIEEVCKALVEQGKLYREDDHWQWSFMEEMEIPQSIKLAIQARVGKLSSTALEIIRAASIIGREFNFDILKTISGMSENALVEALEEAERSQLITEVRDIEKKRPTGTTFTFMHALIASTLRDSMSSLRRQRLHQRAALALEQLYPDRIDELAPQLGQHFSNAGVWDKAALYLLRSGDRARQVYAYPEAIEYYQRALVILKERQDFEGAARTLMKLGLLYHATFDFQHSRQAYQEGFALWKEAGETPDTSLIPAPHALRMTWKDPLTLDPALAFDATSVPIITQLFVGLVSLTPDMDISPELAQRWEVLENGKKYIFHMRENAVWTDGKPITAYDIEYAWKRALKPETHSQNYRILYDIRGAREYHLGQKADPDEVGVRAKDAFTLVVELEEPTGYFLYLLAYPATYPVPRHIIEAKGSTWTHLGNLVSSGPFQLAEWKREEYFTLSRNPNYHGRCTGNVTRVEISSKPEFFKLTARLAAYQAGLFDVCGLGGYSSESERARQQHAGEYISLPLASVNFLVFDTTRPPFDDVRVRRAFTQAIDRETLAEVHLRGYVYPAMGGLVPVGLPGHSPDMSLPYAPDQARLSLAEAGFPSGHGFPEVEVWLIATETSQIREYIHDQWLEILGIESRWEAMPAEKLYSKLEQMMPHIFYNGWLADYPDPDDFLRVGMGYEARWHNQTYEQLVENARRVTDQAERMKMYREAERILNQEAAIVPLFYTRSHRLIKPWVRRFPVSPTLFFMFKDVIIEPHES